jgi:hypothetical protein
VRVGRPVAAGGHPADHAVAGRSDPIQRLAAGRHGLRVLVGRRDPPEGPPGAGRGVPTGDDRGMRGRAMGLWKAVRDVFPRVQGRDDVALESARPQLAVKKFQVPLGTDFGWFLSTRRGPAATSLHASLALTFSEPTAYWLMTPSVGSGVLAKETCPMPTHSRASSIVSKSVFSSGHHGDFTTRLPPSVTTLKRNPRCSSVKTMNFPDMSSAAPLLVVLAPTCWSSLLCR